MNEHLITGRSFLKIMKRIPVGIIIMAVLMLVGCNNVITNSQVNTTPRLEDKNRDIEMAAVIHPDQSNSRTSSPMGIQSSNLSNYVKTYKDKTHKNIKYEKLSFNIGSYHIVSITSSDNTETFNCKIDKGEGYSWTKTHMTVTVRAIEKQDFLDSEKGEEHLCNMYPNYDKIRIYNNVTDNSGIISLYIVSEGDQTKYVVFYKDAYYLIESDVDEIYLLKTYPSEYYEMKNLKIKCANSNITHVNETISYNKNKFKKAEYVITQGKGGAKYSAELSRDEEYQYHFTLKNEKDKKLLILSTYGEFDEVIKILDVNMDGYADIQFLKQSGTMNNSYVLYVWDNSAKNFVKVKCKEILSYFEVHNGYLINWQKESGNSGGIQKLVWKNMNTLIKASEEPYHAD